MQTEPVLQALSFKLFISVNDRTLVLLFILLNKLYSDHCHFFKIYLPIVFTYCYNRSMVETILLALLTFTNKIKPIGFAHIYIHHK